MGVSISYSISNWTQPRCPNSAASNSKSSTIWRRPSISTTNSRSSTKTTADTAAQSPTSNFKATRVPIPIIANRSKKTRTVKPWCPAACSPAPFFEDRFTMEYQLPEETGFTPLCAYASEDDPCYMNEDGDSEDWSWNDLNDVNETKWEAFYDDTKWG